MSKLLSARENDVLRLLAAGLSYIEIGARLKIAQNTVKTHIKHVYAKLGVRSAMNACNRARELGLL